MYEQSAKWNAFYMETEPDKRLEMFNELCMTEPDDGANEYRKILLDKRYKNPKDPKAKVDNYLWQCINLPYLYKNTKLFTKSHIKELKKVWKDMGFDEVSEYGEVGEKALYWEVRNMARRYFGTCNDKGYGRKLFGLVSANDDERTIHMCKDAWTMSYGLADKLMQEDMMKVFNQAVKDEYCTVDDGAADRFAGYEKELAESKA